MTYKTPDFKKIKEAYAEAMKHKDTAGVDPYLCGSWDEMTPIEGVYYKNRTGNNSINWVLALQSLPGAGIFKREL